MLLLNFLMQYWSPAKWSVCSHRPSYKALFDFIKLYLSSKDSLSRYVSFHQMSGFTLFNFHTFTPGSVPEQAHASAVSYWDCAGASPIKQLEGLVNAVHTFTFAAVRIELKWVSKASKVQ